MEGGRSRPRTSSQPPDTDLDYYSRPENYKGSNLDNMTSFLLARSREEQKPAVVGRRYKRRDKRRELFHRYRHILPPDLCDTSSSSLSSLSSSSDELEVHQDGDASEDVHVRQNDRQWHSGKAYRHSWQLVRLSHPQVQGCHAAMTPSNDDRPDSRSGSWRTRDAPPAVGSHREDINRVGDQRREKNDGVPQDVRDVGFGGRLRYTDGLRPVTRSGTPSARGSPVGSRIGSARSRLSTMSREVRRALYLNKFKRLTLAVVNVLKLAKVIIKRTDSPSALLKTFTALSRQPEEEVESENMKNYGLQFDLSHFRANKEITISSEVKNILSLPPSHRTPEQIQTAMFGLQSLPSFAEYPLHMQEKLAKVAWHEIVTPQRTIIRQGHFAENFYFILSGQAVVTIRKPGETSAQTAAIMRKGTSFGELALLHHSRRTATVTSHDTVQLLSVGREDFFDIFMSGHRAGETPEHIQFISQLDFMKEWPLERLLERPDQCLLHFFKRNTVIVKDSKVSDWFYVVKSGSCRVLKQLKRVNASLGPPRHQSGPARDRRTRHGPAAWRPELRHTPGRQLHRKTRPGELTQPPPSDAIKDPPNEVTDKPQLELPVFVQIELLKPKNVFGLDMVNSNLDSNPPSVSLVSLGAECVMLSKAFFIKHASDALRKRLAEITQPYPDEDSLQDSLQTKVNWERYKRSLLVQVASHKQTGARKPALTAA